MDDMARNVDRTVGKSPGIVRLSAIRGRQRAPLHGYAGKQTRSWRPKGSESRGTTGCCIRSKSSWFTIHSFREGNTRTQFVFFSELSRHAGYELDIAQFAENAPLRTEFVYARFYNQSTTRTDRLEAVLNKAFTEAHPPVSARSAEGAHLEDLMRNVRLAFPSPPTTTRGRSSATSETLRPAETRKREQGHNRD